VKVMNIYSKQIFVFFIGCRKWRSFHKVGPLKRVLLAIEIGLCV
jgi:hypothetical protein